MSAARTFLLVSLTGLALAVAVGVALAWLPHPSDSATDLTHAHEAAALFGFLVPAFGALHLHSVASLTKRPAPPRFAARIAELWLLGALLLAVGAGLGHADLARLLQLAGGALLTVAALLITGLLIMVLPKRGESVVDVAADPLTKGDDASFTHLRFAHFLLPLGVLLTAFFGPWFAWEAAWTSRAWLAGLHLLLAGYGLFSCYGLSHLWIPRLSGVPAIAAGAIKGELHTSLLGLLLLVAGFAAGVKGLAIAGGALLFLGAFTWMGVLGANIMRNKSRTQRVTPEFVYVPWVFTGVFWLISGVLLGIFLNVVPGLYADRLPALRFTHVHIAVFGGFTQVLLGIAMRLLPKRAGLSAMPFSRSKWAFYLLNAGLATMLYGHLAASVTSTAFRVGALLSAAGLAGAFISLSRHRAKAEG